jgi:hypothetical protein
MILDHMTKSSGKPYYFILRPSSTAQLQQRTFSRGVFEASSELMVAKGGPCNVLLMP